MPISSVSNIYNNTVDALSNFRATKDSHAEEASSKGTSLKGTISENLQVSDTKKTEVKTQNIFDRLLNANSETKINSKQDFDTLSSRLDDLRAKGKTLLHHPLPNEIRDYVSDVKSFLGDLRDNAYSAKYKDQLFQRMDVTDKRLDKLADDFLQGQKPELDLVHSLGELQGILVDVFA